MTKRLFLLLSLALCLYWYVTTLQQCQVPLTYKIDAIDERFNLSAEEAKNALTEAEAVWEKIAERDLFVPVKDNESADIFINFVFDDRHERFLAEESLRQSLDNKEVTSESLQSEYDKLVKIYEKKLDGHDKKVALYEFDLESYNKEVEWYNQNGGAPEDVFSDLEARERLLNNRRQEIDKNSNELKIMTERINELGQRGNELIRQYNTGVETYNDSFNDAEEFTQGDYASGNINIYTFENKPELVTVLAHELGHALDIDHVEGSSSVMYYLLEDQPTPLVLSSYDAEELKQTCGVKGTFGTWVRTIINSYL